MTGRLNPCRASTSKTTGTLSRFSADKSGTVGLVVAASLLPMLLVVGFSFDAVRIDNTRTRAQDNLDSALLAGVGKITSMSKDDLRTYVNDWFNSQQGTTGGTFAISNFDVDQDQGVLTVKVKGSVPTTFAALMGVNEWPVELESAAVGGDKPNLEVSIALDKSASMLLAGTPEDQKRMNDAVGCTFGCHQSEGRVRDTPYFTFYDWAVANNITFRIDIAASAILKSLSLIEQADPARSRIKIALYKIGSDASRVLAPTYDLNTARQRLSRDEFGLTSTTSDTTTFFNVSLPRMASAIGQAGDGSSVAKPKKLVIIVTDGVQAVQDWVHHAQDKVAPLNPRWCDDFKKNGNTVAVLYTRYLAMSWDWGYNATVGDSMSSARWYENWSGVIDQGVSGSISRHDYIPYALRDCASEGKYFISADSNSEIEEGMKFLLRAYLSSPRLTR